MTRVTATLPFILITAFVARAVTLPGAYSGLQYLFTPDWNVLRSGEVWYLIRKKKFNVLFLSNSIKAAMLCT